MQPNESTFHSESLPIGFECPSCRYDLSASTRRICPECGREATNSDIAAFRSCIDAAVHVPGRVRRIAYAGVLAAILAWIGAGLLVTDPFGRVMIGLLVAGLVGFSLLGGFVGSLLSPRRERAAWFLAWLKTLAWLHGPWLVVPALMGLVFLGGQIHASGAAMVFGGVSWVIWVFACLVNWFDAYSSVRTRMALSRRQIVWAFNGLAVVCVMLSAGLVIATVFG